MTKHEIRNQVLETGCASVAAEDLRAIWPASRQFGPGWDVAKAIDWCESYRLQVEIDPTTNRVYFSPQGIYAPAVT